MVQDKYYGFEALACLSEHVITSLFSVAPSTVEVGLAGITPPQSPTPGHKDSPPPLGEWIAYALYRTRLPESITHQALLLLSRLKARYPSARGTATSPHRLFLSSLMLSSKISMDDTYSNKSWQVVGQGLFSLREVNQMERELFAFLGWNVVVRDEELAAFTQDVVAVFEAERVASTASLVDVVPNASTSAVSVPRAEKRRRSTSSDSNISTSSSSSSHRSPSPDDRQRRASDAAIALLRGSAGRPSTKSTSRSPRSRTRSSDSRSSSPYSSRPPSTYSSSSSTVGSPASECSTFSSPSTPISAGPLTPSHTEHHLAPAWAKNLKESAMDYSAPHVEVATW